MMTRRYSSFFLVCLAVVIGFARCSSYGWNVPRNWAKSEQLQSVSDSSPHGTVNVTRTNRNLFLLINESAVFRADPASLNGTFQLAPGHYVAQAIQSGQTTSSSVIKKEFDVSRDAVVTITAVAKRGWVYWGDEYEFQK